MWMLELRKKRHLAIGALGICGILESIEYFLQCIGVLRFTFDSFPDMTVGPASHEFFRLVMSQDVLFDILAHRN